MHQLRKEKQGGKTEREREKEGVGDSLYRQIITHSTYSPMTTVSTFGCALLRARYAVQFSSNICTVLLILLNNSHCQKHSFTEIWAKTSTEQAKGKGRQKKNPYDSMRNPLDTDWIARL